MSDEELHERLEHGDEHPLTAFSMQTMVDMANLAMTGVVPKRPAEVGRLSVLSSYKGATPPAQDKSLARDGRRWSSFKEIWSVRVG